MPNTTKNTKTLRFVDLFAGIGGFHLGLENANKYGLERVATQDKVLQKRQEKVGDSRKGRIQTNGNNADVGQSPKVGFKCVYSNEWDKYASQIYKKHYGVCDTTDITKVNAKDIPAHDLLCAGFPCQSFSIAGKRKGFEDTRGTLFFDVARILSEKGPRLVLLENVKGLLNHDKGKTFQTILGVLTDLGYRVEWQVLNSKHFGVPQNRERVFIIGHLGEESRQQIFPIGKGRKVNNEQSEQGNNFAHTIQTSDKYRGDYIKYGNSQDQKLSQDISQTLSAGHYNQPKIIHNRYGGFGEGLRVFEKYSPTIRTPKGGGHILEVLENMKIRRLTPIECERLQGFPDNWTEYGTEGKISDTQRYKVLGNAVTTNVITEIGRKLITC